ncbi:MAG: isochorismatase family protein [bacterium]|nr:MAG: isochorismatase family protein [bacterium]
MKEGYFTPDSIGEQSRRMLEGLEGLRARHPVRFTPRRAALLVLDMQRYFLDEDSHAFIPSAPAIVPGIAALADTFLMHDLPVVFTRHRNSEADAGMMADWWSDLISPESGLFEIVPELNRPAAMVIEKSQYDAFHETELDGMLREAGIEQLVITGVMTHLCCETTARSAFMRGFAVFFPVDGSATYREDFHRAALLNLSHGFAVPVLVDDLIASIGERDRA